MDNFINELLKYDIKNINEYSPLTLAFVGDAVHTLFIKTNILSAGNFNVNTYHKLASTHCKASGQAKMLDKLTEILTKQELDIVRRARNSKNHHTAKNADIETYKKATSFEALIGYLFLTKQYDRLLELLNMEEF